MKIRMWSVVLGCTLVLSLGCFGHEAEAHLNGGTIATQPGPAPGEQYTSLSSGIFTYSVTDLSLPGPMPINVTRVYRSDDYIGAPATNASWKQRDFGIGTKLNYDIYLHSNSELLPNPIYTDAEVVLPDGGLINCQRSDTHSANDYLDAVFVCNEQTTGVWFASTINYNNSGWDLHRPDGTTFHFGDETISPATAALQTITDRWGNQITINRSSGSTLEGPGCNFGNNVTDVPSGAISTIISSNGRSVNFCYGSNANEITGVFDNQLSGIKGVTYGYDSSTATGRLSTVTYSKYSQDATTTYQYNQATPPGNPPCCQNSTAGFGNISTITVNDFCSDGSLTCASPSQFKTFMSYIDPPQNAQPGSNFRYFIQSISSQLPGNGYSYAYNTFSQMPAGQLSYQGSYQGPQYYVSEVTATLPDGSQRRFWFDGAGYVTKDIRNPGSAQEVTVFTRGGQPVGTLGSAAGTTEFISTVDEQDATTPNPNTLRETTYNYDAGDTTGSNQWRAGNILSTSVSPLPGQNTCCSNPATWSYTYTTFRRLASAVEPLANNGTGTTYAYNDTCPATMTVTDPLGRHSTVTYNCQGQPVTMTDGLNNSSQIAYSSNGDVLSTTDPLGTATTQYLPDQDGRVTQVTSPLGEVTTYAYDAEDHVTDVIVDFGSVPQHLNLHSNYTYDLLGEIVSSTNPNGNTTTWARNATLTKITVKDPLGNTTITDIDNMGGGTDFTDKRGIETTYGAPDSFGRFTGALFNANNVSGYLQFGVYPGAATGSAYDALDRPKGMHSQYETFGNPNTLHYDSIAYTYDGVDNVLSEAETPGTVNLSTFVNTPGLTSPTLAFSYDKNGRRTQLTSTVSGIAFPTINYGYDCADELVSMSNDGSQLTSCGPSTFVNYTGNTSTEAAYNYDADGALANSIANGIQTVFTLDADERAILQTFQTVGGSCPGSPPGCFGTLSYGYDLDGRLIDEGGSLAAIDAPAGETATYSVLDQIVNFNGVPVTYEMVGTKTAENIKSDPSTGLTYTWNSRNQLTTLSGSPANLSNVFDPLGRRESLTTSAYSSPQYFLHDGGALIGYQQGIQSQSLLTPPGGGLPASDVYINQGQQGTQTEVPLYDAFGSTIEIVLLGNPQIVSNYGYDPYGVMKVNSGYRSPFPFLFHGLEQEYYDSQKLYWEPNGNVYNPDPFQLSPSGPQGLGGGGNGEPRSIVFGTQNAPVNWVGISLGVAQNIAGIFSPNTLTIGSDPPLKIVIPYNPFDLLGGLFQGGIPTIPWYDTTHTSRGAHPVYPRMGIKNVVAQKSSAQQSDRPSTNESPDHQPTGPVPPLSKSPGAPPSACSQYDTECAQNPGDQYACQAGNCCRAFGNSSFGNCTRGCLLDFEKGACSDSAHSTACRREAHVACYANCATSAGNYIEWWFHQACRDMAPYVVPGF